MKQINGSYYSTVSKRILLTLSCRKKSIEIIMGLKKKLRTMNDMGRDGEINDLKIL